jgi:hypothetical protein
MLREYAASIGRRRGIGRVRRALELADEESRSPTETWMRLIWMLDAGLPRPLCNRAVYDLGGRLLGVPDLLDPVAGVVGEYDGDEHRFAVRRARDAEKDDLYRRAGLEPFRVVAPDLIEVGKVVDRMRATHDRATRASHPRLWTLEPPAGVAPRQSLDDLLAEREHYRRLGREHQEFLGSLRRAVE